MPRHRLGVSRQGIGRHILCTAAGTHAAMVMVLPWRHAAPANRSALHETGVNARVGPAWRDCRVRAPSASPYTATTARSLALLSLIVAPYSRPLSPATHGFLLYITQSGPTTSHSGIIGVSIIPVATSGYHSQGISRHDINPRL